LKDTMHPEKPEDWEVALPTDKKVLRKMVEEMLVNDTESKMDDNIIYVPVTSKPKCTCPIKIQTKKRKKHGQLITVQKANNGYYNKCPIHSKL